MDRAARASRAQKNLRLTLQLIRCSFAIRIESDHMQATRYSLPPLHVRLQRIFDLELTAHQKLLLLYYVCHRADHDSGATHVGQSRAARECAFSRRTVQRTLRELRQLGLLQGQRRTGQSNRTHAGAEMVLFHKSLRNPQAPAGGDASAGRAHCVHESYPVRHRYAQSSIPIQRDVQRKSSPEDAVLSLWKEIRKTAEGLTLKNWQWAASRILARAKTPPRSPAAFLRKSWPRFLAAWPEEVVEWLEEEAFALMQLHESLADVADLLKCRAAEYDLRYSPESIDLALERASRRLEKQRRVQSELRVGRAHGR